MAKLIGLEGADGTARDCEFFSTPSRALKILRSGVAATAAADNGAINVWRDDDGMYRCERFRMMSRKAHASMKTQKEVVVWLKVELPKIL
jgi:hypothetical protein